MWSPITVQNYKSSIVNFVYKLNLHPLDVALLLPFRSLDIGMLLLPDILASCIVIASLRELGYETWPPTLAV